MARPKEFDRQEALDRAMDLFWEQGYETTGMSDVCTHVGIGRQSLYDTFGGKRALFEEALRRYDEKNLRPIIATLDAPGSPIGNVYEVLDLWEAVGSSPGFKGCLMANSIAEFGARDRGLERRLAAMLRSVEEGFERAFTRARDAGEIVADIDPRSMARLFATTGQGLSVVGKLDASGAYAADALAGIRRMLSTLAA